MDGGVCHDCYGTVDTLAVTTDELFTDHAIDGDLVVRRRHVRTGPATEIATYPAARMSAEAALALWPGLIDGAVDVDATGAEVLAV